MRPIYPLVFSSLIVTLGVTGCSSAQTAPVAADTATSAASPSSHIDRSGVSKALAALEQEYHASVGVVATDTSTGESVSFNRDRRFGYASTLKAFAAGEFLHSVTAADRDELVHWSAADVSAAGYSPVTEQHIDDGLTYSQLVEAAIRQSDNTAMNLVLKRIGGPAGLGDALSKLGDSTTDVVNYEPDLNTLKPGSTDDTTTPKAFTKSLATFLNGNTLSNADTEQLTRWMTGNRTGDSLIRAGAPEGWIVADKSGGAGSIRNDIATVIPPGKPPIVISVLTTKNNPDEPYDDSLIAKTAAAVLKAFA